ncbi:MAG TPA: NAD(P)/FAD-dependent oxidoreductase [Chloroflexota bacterium]|nr:NAD(P)/FAD-dependent oxidoreductase [Chloroflexota bacterium]
MPRYDAVVVGSGPNGLMAAITLARAGRSVLVIEGQSTIGGGVRSGALTLPGFVHDLGSAVYPFAVGSPCLSRLPLEEHGLHWVHPAIPLAHPLDAGTAAVLERSLRATAAGLGVDGPAYLRLMAPVVRDWERIAPAILGPARLPRHPLAVARFGARAIWPAGPLAKLLFRTPAARALLGGLAAHACLPLETPPTAAVALVLAALAHRVGWPFPQGGAQRLTDALASYLRQLGGEIVTGRLIEDLDQPPPARVVLCDVSPRALGRLAGRRLPEPYLRALDRYRHGPGVFKVDWALSGSIPWLAPACKRAGTVHLGGTLAEIAAAERAPWRGEHSLQPYMLLGQPTIFDSTRAPAGKHVAWAYCHVPRGSTVDMTEPIERMVERFAPGFQALILARCAMGPADLERSNPNLVGGDITAGVSDLRQLFIRPTLSLTPYRTPAKGLYLCSASTPPGPGVHGLCGYHAARTALRDGY